MSMMSHFWLALERISSREHARAWWGPSSLGIGLRVNFEQVGGLCLIPRTCVPLRRCSLGLGYDLGLSLYCLEAHLAQPMA